MKRSTHTRKARDAVAKKLARVRGKEKGANPARGTSFEAAVEIARRAKRKGKDDAKKA